MKQKKSQQSLSGLRRPPGAGCMLISLMAFCMAGPGGASFPYPGERARTLSGAGGAGGHFSREMRPEWKIPTWTPERRLMGSRWFMSRK